MKSSLKLALCASSIVGLSLALTPGALARYGYDDRNRSISTAPETGGYCDYAGCPDHFWRFPIHYGPVFFHGKWYRGPVYFRSDRYGREYWVRGGWHRDEWRGRRPGWARRSYDGPPLGFEYYANHGFQLGDHWRHEHDADAGGNGDWRGAAGRDYGGDHSWNGGHHHDNGGDQGRNWSDNGGDRSNSGGTNGDWRTGGTNSPNYDQNRSADNNGGRNGNGTGDQRYGYDNGGQPQGSGANTIHVTGATYGAICHVPQGNVTKFLGDACNGKGKCEYTVQYQTIGDPAPGCAKDFSVQWTCSAGPGGSATAPAEAGFGSKVTLQCASGGQR